MVGMEDTDPLGPFLPPVRQWFRATLGEPTAPQRLGWPSILAGRHTLILAPTGSGKTLAAFLACLDSLWRQDPLGVAQASRLCADHRRDACATTPWRQDALPRGVRVLYISPLKALNNDIHRNLQIPLEGVAETARALGQPLPAI